jgi:hypothetical protein
MTAPNGRYQVERLMVGGWILTDAFETYEAADAWAHTLLTADRGLRGGVRVLDMERERAERDAVVWAVMG